VAGLSKSFRASPPFFEFNVLLSEPASASNDEPPIRPAAKPFVYFQF
jgi:hypothetical protein